MQGLLNCNWYNEQKTRRKHSCMIPVTVIFQDPSEKKKEQQQQLWKIGQAAKCLPWLTRLFPTCYLEERTRMCPHMYLRRHSPPITVISGLKNEAPKASNISYHVCQLTVLRIGRNGKEKMWEVRMYQMWFCPPYLALWT